MGSRIGLVLGAGGAGGWMFHVGVLEALEDATGFTGGDAELIVGTSAGALVGASLRAGTPASTIGDVLDTPPSPEDREVVMSELKGRKRSLRPLSPALARHAVRSGAGFAVALSGLLPSGLFPTWPLTARASLPIPEAWNGLWIPALSVEEQKIVMFGRDRSDVSVGDAVEASSALPGLFQPKRINGVDYTDGGAVSATHADSLQEYGLDAVVISSPMSRPGSRPLLRLARRRLSEELGVLRRAGVPTMTVEPSADSADFFRRYRRRHQASGAILRAHGRHAARGMLTQSPKIVERLDSAG